MKKRIYFLKAKAKFSNPQLGADVYVEKEVGDWRETLENVSQYGYDEYLDCMDPNNGYGVCRIQVKRYNATYIVKFPLMIDVREIVYNCTALANMMAIDSSPDGKTFNMIMAPRTAQFLYDEFLKILECKEITDEQLQAFADYLRGNGEEPKEEDEQ
jgi:hypothetical protein